MFKHTGIPCRHIVKVSVIFKFPFVRPPFIFSDLLKLIFNLWKSQVLMQQGVQELPSRLVMNRWTIHARSRLGCDLSANEALGHHDAGKLHGVLYTTRTELLSLGRTSRQAFEISLGHVSRAKAEISNMKTDAPDKNDDVEDDVSMVERDATADCRGLTQYCNLYSRSPPQAT
jgi:hypothetical protein